MTFNNPKYQTNELGRGKPKKRTFEAYKNLKPPHHGRCLNFKNGFLL
jgi:hypothetical protein